MTLGWKLVDTEDGWVQVALAGCITESAQLSELLGVSSGRPLRLDLSEVEQVNSCGVREWLHFVQQLTRQRQTFELLRCPPVFVRQLNMISNFGGSATVRSVLLPYWCQACGHEAQVEYDLQAAGTIAESLPCPQCGSSAEFDDLPETYLSFFVAKLDHAG
jgi:anti-anti-sigma regulatory factor/predicted RNA-binding Zn-ribbon protein involved in translation (DUF1610 family)